MTAIIWTVLADLFPQEGMEVIVRGPLLSERRAYWADGLWRESHEGPNGLLVGVVTEWRALREAGVDDVGAA